MTATNVNWELEIVATFHVKQALHEVDKKGIFPFSLPRVAATRQQVEAAQFQLGFEFDDDFAAFLQCGNGWPSFALSTADLFGTAEFLGSNAYRDAMKIMEITAAEDAFRRVGLSLEEVFPICAGEHSADLYVMRKRNKPGEHRVFWFAGYLVDRFPSFLEFFRSMREYDLENINDLKAETEV